MLIIVAGMSRSASTWCYQVACELAPLIGKATFLGYRHDPLFTTEIAELARTSEILVVKSHSPCELMLQLSLEGNALVLYSYRDLRDVAFSLSRKILRPIDTVIAGLPEQIAWQQTWLGCKSVHVLRYESYVLNSQLALNRIARYLGAAASDEQLSEIHNRFTLAANRDRCERKKEELLQRGCDLDDPYHVFRLEHEELVHWNHVRSGEVGQWRHLATPAQLEALDHVAGEWLIEHGYERDRSWARSSGVRIAA